MIQRFITDIETKSFNDDERSFVAWASKSSIDRDDEELDSNGWELKNYKSNPVIPLFHDYSQFPVAKALWVKPDPKDKPIGLLFKPQFAETELGMEAYYLYKNGYMNAFSVGFDPLEWESGGQVFSKAKDGNFAIWQKAITEQKKRKPRCKFIKQELLEISGVVVPAHPEALVEARSFVKNPLLKHYFDNIGKLITTPDIQAFIDDLEARIKTLEANRQEHDQSTYEGNELDFIDDQDAELEFIDDDIEIDLDIVDVEV